MLDEAQSLAAQRQAELESARTSHDAAIAEQAAALEQEAQLRIAAIRSTVAEALAAEEAAAVAAAKGRAKQAADDEYAAELVRLRAYHEDEM
jgi:hypothetical protein